MHRFFFGDLWRDVWTDSADVEVLDPGQFAGGLTPVDAVQGSSGGDRTVRDDTCGRTAGTLLLRGRDNRFYSFRLLNSPPVEVLPSAVRDLFASNLHGDLIAAAHPYAELVTSQLYRHVGVAAREVRLVAFPTEDRVGAPAPVDRLDALSSGDWLGVEKDSASAQPGDIAVLPEEFTGRPGLLVELRGEFGGRPELRAGLPEERGSRPGFPAAHPDGGTGHGSSGGVGPFRSTAELLTLLDQDPRNRVDAVEYLRARIMDLFVGDWSRTEDRWCWVIRGERALQPAGTVGRAGPFGQAGPVGRFTPLGRPDPERQSIPACRFYPVNRSDVGTWSMSAGRSDPVDRFDVGTWSMPAGRSCPVDRSDVGVWSMSAGCSDPVDRSDVGAWSMFAGRCYPVDRFDVGAWSMSAGRCYPVNRSDVGAWSMSANRSYPVDQSDLGGRSLSAGQSCLTYRTVTDGRCVPVGRFCTGGPAGQTESVEALRSADGYVTARQWIPISLSSSHGLARYDGFFPWIGSFVLPQIGFFDGKYGSIGTFAWSSRRLDRRLLSALQRSTWDSVTAVILSRLADSVIEQAVSRLPRSLHARSGAELMSVLKVRRAGLTAAVDEYYRWLACTVDIRGTDRQDHAEVTRMDDTHVRVKISACDVPGVPGQESCYYDRMFSSDETEEIRLFLLGGDDHVVLRGTVKSSIPVLVVGGEGEDRIIDSSHVDGCLFGMVPFVGDAETATYIYDSDSRGIDGGASTSVDVDEYASPSVNTQFLSPAPDDRGSAWRVGMMFDWNSQLGMIAGVGPIYYRYGFRRDPYACRLSLLGGYAPFVNVGRVVFNADSRVILENASVSLEALASGYETLTYYGFGNETDPVLDPNDKYYRVHQSLFSAEPSLQYPARGPFVGSLRAGIRYVRTDPVPESYVWDVRAYGSDDMLLASLGAGIRWDSRDLEPHPYKGLYVDIAGRFVPKAFDVGEAFGKARADLRLFYSPAGAGDLTMTIRLVGEKTWGKVPYFEAASIGSSTLLRGYQHKRFVGNASIAGVFEARVKVGELAIVFPASIGVLGFVETGRVFAPGETSSTWHPSYGIGAWAAPWNRETTLTGSLGFSRESVLLYGSIGFSF